MHGETSRLSSGVITSAADGTFSHTTDEHVGVDTLVCAKVKLNDVDAALTATGLSTLTIVDPDGLDILNGEGGAAISASTSIPFNTIGGIGCAGPITFAGTGAGNTKTFEVILFFKR